MCHLRTRKYIVVALAATIAAFAPAQAEASTSCSSGAPRADYTRGGYEVEYKSYTSQVGMACSSVRYVLKTWIRPTIRRQYRWPHLTGPFYDGYVTWHCYKLSKFRIQCDEYDSYTSLRFTGVVRY